MPQQFYVYIHYRTNDVPFYVGKGYGKRSTSHANRNKRWREIVSGESWENIRIKVIPKGSEEEALEYEKILIAEYRAQGIKLVNVTSGGQGTSGMKHTPATKKKISEAHTGKKLTEAHKKAVSVGSKNRIIKYWPPKTPEAKARMMASRKGHKMGPAELAAHTERMRNRKPISQVGRDNLRIARTGKKDSAERIAKTRSAILAANQRKREAGISLAHTPEHNANIAAALVGHTHSVETRKKISSARIAGNARRRAEKLNRESQQALPV